MAVVKQNSLYSFGGGGNNSSISLSSNSELTNLSSILSLKTVYSAHIKCPVCEKTARYKVVESRKEVPNKMYLISSCKFCNNHNTEEFDLVLNDFSLRITGKFTDPSDLRRRAFINKNNVITFFMDDQAVYKISIDDSAIFTIDTLLERTKEKIVSFMSEGDEMDEIEELLKIMRGFQKTGKFTLVIEDPSGFSRMCPKDTEYNDVSSLPIERFNEEDVIFHEILSKAEET